MLGSTAFFALLMSVGLGKKMRRKKRDGMRLFASAEKVWGGSSVIGKGSA